jgi:AbrB family looped-hinge helix DNA binding protein
LTFSSGIGNLLGSKETKLEENMQVTRISPKRQITIPKEIYDKLHLEAGDFLEVDIRDEGIVLIPKKLISRDQQWFWTKEWQEKEKEADGAIARGEVSKVFDNAEALIKDLRKEK